MDHRSLPPVPIKTQPMERIGEERDEDWERVGGLGEYKSPDRADIIREIESDNSRANTRRGQEEEAMTCLKTTGKMLRSKVIQNVKIKHIKLMQGWRKE